MTFGCEETTRYVDAWIDGELDPGAAMLVETHVVQCVNCRAECEMIRSLKRGLSGLREHDVAPSQLRARIRAALTADDQAATNASSAARRRKHATGFLVAGAALSALVVVTGRNFHSAPPDMALASAGMFPSMLDDIASRHARDLPLEVSSNQPEAVSQFFRGRLDIPVRPMAFRGVSAQLVGARISSVRDQMAAELVYDVGGRRVRVFVFDGSLLPRQGGAGVYRTMVGNQAVYVGNSHGYTETFFEHDGVGYAVASDLRAQDAVRMVADARIE